MAFFNHFIRKITIILKKNSFLSKRLCSNHTDSSSKKIFFFATELMKCFVDSTSRKMTIFSHLKWKRALFSKKNLFSKMLFSNHTICYQNHIFVSQLNFEMPHWFNRQKNGHFWSFQVLILCSNHTHSSSKTYFFLQLKFWSASFIQQAEKWPFLVI